VNLGMVLVVPPAVVTPPPEPAQFPLVRQTVPVASGSVIALAAVGVVNPTVVLLAPLVPNINEVPKYPVRVW